MFKTDEGARMQAGKTTSMPTPISQVRDVGGWTRMGEVKLRYYSDSVYILEVKQT